MWAFLDGQAGLKKKVKLEQKQRLEPRGKTFKAKDCICCYATKPNGRLHPCGHVIMCYDCAIRWIETAPAGTCPTCRIVVTGITRDIKQRK